MLYQIIYQMNSISINTVLIFTILLYSINNQTITANLRLYQYDPYKFQLKFSQTVDLPSFHLLLNNMKILKYELITKEKRADSFHFQVDSTQLAESQSYEDYEVIFLSPFSIQDGRLGMNYYSLSAFKESPNVSFPVLYGTFAVYISYIMVNFTMMGFISIQFLQIYCLLMFKSNLRTYAYQKLSRDLLILDPNINNSYYEDRVLQSIVFCPFILVFLTGIIGYTLRRCVKRKLKITQKIIYDWFVYDCFIVACNVQLFSILFNAIQYFKHFQKGYFDSITTLRTVGFAVSYFGVVTTLFIIYLFLYVLNPKIKQTQSTWKKYLISKQFKSMKRLHDAHNQSPWYKRNAQIITIYKRIGLVFSFFIIPGFQVVVLVSQFLHLFVILITQPFKKQAYLHITLISRLLMFIFYGTMIFGNLYFSMGNITFSYSRIKTYLNIRQSLFYVILLIIFLLNCYQIYDKCSNLNYQIKLVRQQDDYTLKITERNQSPTDEPADKQLKQVTESEKSSVNYRNNRFSIISPQKKNRNVKKMVSLVEKDKSLNKEDSELIAMAESVRSRKKSKKCQFLGDEAQEIDQKRDSLKSSISKREKNKSPGSKYRWKQNSLLTEMFKQQ